jgi:putative redox protein
VKPPINVELVWERELVFSGRSDAATMVLDSAGEAGPSPVQALVFALAGCMGMDVVHIVLKGRFDLRGLRISVSSERSPENPHRLTTAAMRFDLTGSVPDAQVQRAIDLSREKYCSVLHSLAPDIKVTTEFAIASGE